VTYEQEVVIRAILRAKIEEALTAAARLPDLEGRPVVLRLNQALDAIENRRPLRVVVGIGFKRRNLFADGPDGAA
jgi:hypothetical protein